MSFHTIYVQTKKTMINWNYNWVGDLGKKAVKVWKALNTSLNYVLGWHHAMAMQLLLKAS